jgi:hypothetical protein
MTGEERVGRALPIRCHAAFSGQPGVNVKRFRNYCGLMKVARSGFPWEKTTKGDVAPPDFLRAALCEGNDVRLSLRKAAYSSMAPSRSTGNPGSDYTNCETAVEIVTYIDPIRGGLVYAN